MKLIQAAFIYPRIALPYLEHWARYHASSGVERLYATLHLNEPRDRELPFEKIVWPKNSAIPYIRSGAEQELVDAAIAILRTFGFPEGVFICAAIHGPASRW